MPVGGADSRVDTPLFVLYSTTIGASATVQSAAADVAAYDGGAVAITTDQALNVTVQLSFDETTWFDMVAGGVNVVPGPAFAIGNRSFVLMLEGVRFMRLNLQNTSASIANVTARLMASQASN